MAQPILKYAPSVTIRACPQGSTSLLRHAQSITLKLFNDGY